MGTDRRRDAATTLTGAALLGAGGGMRHAGITGALRSKLGREPTSADYPRVHLGALKGAGKGKGLYLTGTAAGLVGAAGLGTGVLNLTRRKEVASKALDPERLARIKRLRDIRGGALGIGGGLGGLGGLSRRDLRPFRRPSDHPLPKWEPKPKKPLTEAQRRGAVEGGRASSETQRERRTGQHRALQAMQRYENRPFNLEKRRDRTPLWQEGMAGTADALRDRKASLQTKAPVRARGTQLAIAGGAGAGGSALARLAMRGAGGRTKALISPIVGALAATASVPASSRAVQHTTRGEYVVTPTGVRRAKDVIKKPSTKAHQVSSRHGPMRHQVVPSSVDKADSYRVQRAKITGAGSTPLVGPYAQAHLAAHYAPAGHKRQAAARQLAMGPAAGMAAGIGAAYGGAALARHVAPVGTKAEHAMQWRSDKINAVRNKVGLGDAKPIAEDSRRGRVLARAKANRLARPLMHNRGTVAAAGLGFLGARALAGGVGTQLAISRNQRDQKTFGKAEKLDDDTLDAWYNDDQVDIEQLYAWDPKSPVGRQRAREARARIRHYESLKDYRLNDHIDELYTALDSAGHVLPRAPQKRDALGRFSKLDPGGRGQSKREKHKLADTKRLNAALATTGGLAGLTSLGLLATRHKARAIPLSIIGSGVGGGNALIGAHVQRREAKAIDPVRKAGVPKKVLIFVGNEGVSRARMTYPERSPALADLHLPETDPVIWRNPYMDRHDQALKIKRLNRKRTGKSTQRAFDNLELPRDTARHHGRVNGQFGKSLGSKPWAGPMKAYHPKHGMLRVLAYHGEGRFTMLDKTDAKRIVHRDQVSFRKSLLPGGQVKRAIHLTAAERAAVRARSGTGARGDLLRRGTSPKNNPVNHTFAALHNAAFGAEAGPKRNVRFAAGAFSDKDKKMLSNALPRKVKRPMVIHPAGELPVNSGLGFPAAGTKRPSHLLIHANDMSVVTHEAAHAMPRRNGARIAAMNPLQRAREEGRADATAMRHHNLSDVMHGDYDSLPRIRRQADAGEPASRAAMSHLHGMLATGRASGETGAGTMASTYHTRAQSRAYGDTRRKLGKPIGPKPFTIGVGKSAGADDNDMIRRYGDRGPLPKNLPREERMRAYQARYDAHGGKKGEKWQRRANISEGARNVALASGTAALAGLAHLKTKRGAKLLAKHPHVQHRLDHLALASGAAGGAAELAGEYSRNRRASYASSPGGVAASALTRMRANTPGGT